MTAPPAADDRVSRRMKRTLGRDNNSERALRSALHRLGLRFRLQRRLLSGSTRTADVVFPSQRVAVFVDGCFWHGCPIHGTWPKRNAEWWRAKIEANVRRDRDTDTRLAELGWRVVRVWEHETSSEAALRVASIVRKEAC
jgi:DNA mismatch endonuclease (patch repair protein)